jgi:hypothetical protein
MNQTQLMKSLKSDIIRQRRTIQNSLATRLANDIRKHRVVDEHFDTRHHELTRTAETIKKTLHDKETYYARRGSLAMDMAYTHVLHTLGKFEKTVVDEFGDLKREDDCMLSDVKALEYRMKSHKNECLFFKNL